VTAAATQLGVKRVENVTAELADLDLPDQRPDVPVCVPDVRHDRVPLEVDHLEVPVEHLIDSGARARTPALVDLVQQPGPNRLRLRSRLRARWNHLNEVVPTPGDRVLSRVDPHP
jgi:hypothetical protein